MSVMLLGWRNIQRRLASSVATGAIVMLTVLVAVTGACTYRAIGAGLSLASDRLGADIIVLPSEVGVSAQEALFVAEPANVYMPANTVDIVESVPGVERVTPQFFTQSLNQSCCSVLGVTRVVGVDPEAPTWPMCGRWPTRSLPFPPSWCLWNQGPTLRSWHGPSMTHARCLRRQPCPDWFAILLLSWVYSLPCSAEWWLL